MSQSFTDASFALPIERITDANTNYIGMWTARARSGRRVRFYNFAASNPNAQLLLYDGPDMTSAIINNRCTICGSKSHVSSLISLFIMVKQLHYYSLWKNNRCRLVRPVRIRPSVKWLRWLALVNLWPSFTPLNRLGARFASQHFSLITRTTVTVGTDFFLKGRSISFFLIW